jgi:FlaA1/EpsC-like NDP-sugar epimerase
MSAATRHKVINPLLRFSDLAIVCLTFLATMAVSSGSSTWPGFAEVLVIRIKVANFILFLGYLAMCAGIFSACGLFRSHRLSHWKQRMYERLLAVTLMTATLLILRWLFDLSFATNQFFPLFWLLTVCALTVSHEVVLQLLQIARINGRNLRHVIIVGDEPDASALANRIRRETGLGYRVLQIINTREALNDGRNASDF